MVPSETATVSMKTRLTCLLLILIVVTANAALSAEPGPDQFEGQWTLLSMTNNGIEIPDENLQQTRVSVAKGHLSFDKFWRIACKNPIDPVTKTAEGYLEGLPGLRYELAITPNREPGEIDLTVSSLIPAEEERDEKTNIKGLIQKRLIRASGIYTLNGDKLTICWHEWSIDHGSSRPTDFTAKPNSDRILVVLQRKEQK